MQQIPFILSLTLLSAISPLQAEVFDTGDVTLNGNDVFIGNTSFGSREVNEGISHGVVSLGNSAGILGEFLITEGSFLPGWLSATDITIGSNGNGLLSSVGGSVSANSIVIGDAVGSTGSFSAYSGSLDEQGYNVTSGFAGSGAWW